MAALGCSTFRGTAIPTTIRMSTPRAAVAFTPIRASQTLQGRVVSTTCEKTAVVAIDTLVVHPVYKKRVKSTKKYIAHDEDEQAKVGDVVTLAPTRPLSKKKRFVVETIVKAAN